MKCFSLPWVAHRQGEEAQAIQSIDISCCGTRFATGGLDHNIKVWSLARIFLADDDPALNTIPTLLSTLSRHSSPVHSVRFSWTGQYLASGGADGRVLVYHLLAGEGGTVIGSKAKNLENWAIFRVYQQNLDVSEVAWGPECRKDLLATASYDASVNVYDVSMNSLLLCLKGHHHLIKGLCWDPLGEFLASQAEQEGVFVWDISSGACISKINKHLTHSTKAFEQSRLDWGPTGRFIAAAVGFDNPCFIVPLFARDKWDGEQSYVGHQALVTVAKYNPKLFFKNGPTQAPGPSNRSNNVVSECIALGSADATFSVWLSHKSKPLIRGKRFSSGGITDLAWSRDGFTLLCCSLDGKVFGVNFEEYEIGENVSDEVNEKLMYGAAGAIKAAHKKLPVPETVEQLLMEKGRKLHKTLDEPTISKPQPVFKSARGSTSNEVDLRMSTNNVVKEQQKPYIQQKEGVPTYPSMNQASEPICLISSSAGTSPQGSPVQKLRDLELSRKDKCGNDGEGALGKAGGEPGAVHDNGSGPRQGFGSVHGGKDGGADAKLHEESKVIDAAGKGDKEPALLQEGLSLTLHEDKGVKGEKESKGVSKVVQESKELEDALGVRDMVDDAGSGKGMRKRMRLENRVNQGPGMLSQVAKVAKTSGKDEKRGKLIDRKKQAQAPIIRKEFTVALGKLDNGEPAILEVLNQPKGAKVISKAGKSVAWSTSLDGAVVQAGGNQNFIAVATRDGLLKVYDSTGRQLSSTIRLSSAVSFLETDSESCLLGLLSDARLWMWDVRCMKCTLEASVEDLGGTNHVASASISQSGRPVIILKNRDTFVYNPDLRHWALLADSKHPYPGFLSKHAQDSAGELGRIQMAAGEGRSPPQLVSNPAQNLEYLESNMCSARSLDSPKDFKRWFSVYVRNLVSVTGSPQAQGNEEAKLRKLCLELLGLGDGMGSDLEWVSTRLGLDRQKWVETDILHEIGRNRELQRLREELESLLERDGTEGS